MRMASLSREAHAALDALFRDAVEREEVPGVVAQIANHDHTLYLGAFGARDDRGATEISADAMFRMMSMTKPVTTVAAMMLKEQGRLDLDDPVSRYLPEYKDAEVIADVDKANGSYTTRSAACEITIRHLLNHTAGFGYTISSDKLGKLSEKLPTEPPLLHDPGTRWTYGTGTRVIGRVIEQLSGESLDAFFQSHIFEPLGMTDTGYDLKPQDAGRLVSTYRRTGGKLVGQPNSESYKPQVFGDYGLLSTAGDYVRFLQMLLNRGRVEGTSLLSVHSVGEMTANQIGSLLVTEQRSNQPELANPFPIGAGTDKFGFGFQLKEGDETDSRSPGSYSWAGLHNTFFWVDPGRGIAVVLLMQVLPFYDESCIRLLTGFEKQVCRQLR